MPFHLVTNSDLELRDINNKNLFLGSWCVPYKEKISTEGMNYNYVIPNFIDKKTLDKNHKKVIKYSEILFTEVSKILNNHHNEKFNNRQWLIMIGSFIHQYVSLMINRYDNLDRAIKNYDISSSTFYPDNYDISCKNNTNFLKICDENLWNNVLYHKLLNYIDHKFEKKIIVVKKKNHQTPQSKSIKYFLKKLLTFTFKNQIINSKSFIINTYLNKIDELKLLYLFKQPPIFFQYELDYKSTDFALRSKLKLLLQKNQNKDFESALRGIFFEIFPNIYLESFENLNSKLKSMVLPKNPKLIFNSNDYVENEIFKLYCAKKVENSKYIIGQHGCNYGSSRYQNDQMYVLKTADKFITWGWYKNEKTVRGFLFPKLTPTKKKGKKITYMIRFITPHWRTYDLHHELENEFNDDFNLIRGFNENIKKNLQIKMHHGDGRFFDFNTKLRWLNQFPNIKLVNTKANFNKFKNNSKLFIFNFESTGFLQLININFPCLMVLRNFDGQKDDQYKKYYEYLIKAKILHLNNDSLIEHLNEVESNVNEWWNLPNTQDNLKEYVKIFANNINSSPQDLKKILLKI